MRRRLSVAVLVLLCFGSALGRGQCVVHQGYSGSEIKPRGEVAWVWFDQSVGTWDVDGQRPANWPDWLFLPGPPKGRYPKGKGACKGYWNLKLDNHRILELLPGNHVLLVFYAGIGGTSKFSIPLTFNAAAGKSYRVKPNAKIWTGNEHWTPVIEEFNP